MEQYKIDFSTLQWKELGNVGKAKIYKQNDKQIRLVEFTDAFVETDWCTKGHIAYIIEGKLEVNFDGNVVIFNTGDVVFIPAGEKNKHKGRALTKIVKMLFVEDTL